MQSSREYDTSKPIIDTMGALVVLLDRSGRIVQFNRACQDLTGYDEAEAVGRLLWDFLLLPEEKDAVVEVFGELRAGVFPSQFENHWVTKAGTLRLIMWSNTALLDERGEVETVVGTGIDITERRRAERELRASETRYRAVLEQATEAIFIADKSGHYVDVNPAACQMLGYARDELLQLTMGDLIKPEDLAQHPLRIDELIAGRVLTVERQLLRKDGSTFTGEIAAKMLEDGRLLGIARDVEERKRADEALRRRDAILEAVAFASEEFLRTVDWEGSIQQAIEHLSLAANATHAYLIQIDDESASAPAFRTRFAWTAPGYAPIDLPDLYPSQAQDLASWGYLLRQDLPIYGVTRTLPIGQQSSSWLGFKTVVIVPVFVEQGMWGVIGLGHCTLEEDWKTPEVDALRAAASMFGAALLRWESVKRRAAQERFLTTLADITQMSMQIPDIEEMLQTLADRVVDIIDADDCYITLWDDDTQQSRPIAASSGLREEFKSTGIRPAAESVTGATLRHGGTLVVEDIEAVGFASPAEAQRFRARSGIAIPLMAGTRPLGVFFLTFHQPHHFSPDEIVRCERATQQVALVLAKARLLSSEQAARRRAETLQTITQALSSSIQLDAVLDTIMSELRRVLPYDSVSIQEIQGTASVIIACRGFPDQVQILGMRFDLNSESTPNREVVLSRQPLILADAPRAYAGFATFLQAPLDIHSWLGVPLIIGGQVIGMISLDKQETDFYTREHRDLALAFAAQAAVAIQNARLFEETQRRALQQEALNTIIAAAATAPDLASLTSTAMNSILASTDLHQGAIWAAGHYHRVDLPSGLLAAVMSNRRPTEEPVPPLIAIEDWSMSDIPEVVEWLVEPLLSTGIRASFFTPIMVAGKQIGGLVLCSPSPRHWPEEEVLSLQSVAQQIGTVAQRLHLAQEVRQQAQQLQQVLDTIADGMLLLDAQRRILFANPASTDYLKLLRPDNAGDSLEQLGGLPIGRLLEPTAANKWHEIVLEQPDWRLFEVNARAVEVAPGQASAGWVLSITDVTLQRRQQEQVQAQERLAALGRMAAGIAHDFNNILQGMIGFADIVARQPGLDEANMRRVARIGEEGRRGADLVRRILEFSRQSPPNLQPVAMETLIPYFADLWRETLPPNIHFSIEIQNAPCMVLADAAQLSHVFTNLEINAVEAMPQGGTLALRLSEIEVADGASPPMATMHPGRWVVVTVTDTGSGIAASDLPRVFEPFFSTKHTGRSAGLGLARAYGIIQQHGGFVSLESQENAGTAVTVYLPALATPDNA